MAGEAEQTVEVYKQLAEADPSRKGYFMMETANVYLRARDKEKAEKLSRRILATSKQKATRTRAKRLLIDILEAQGRLDELEIPE